MNLAKLSLCLRRMLPLVVVIALFAAPASADTLMNLIPPQNTNLALGGTPSSSGGWGGGWNTSSINDGLREYNTWASGLAFYWDSSWKWMTIDFGAPTTFNMVVLWQHGLYHVPTAPTLDVWNGSAWVQITLNQRVYDVDTTQCYAPGTGSGGSTCDIYMFDAVTGSAVRWSFYPGDYGSTFSADWAAGGPHHGWVYEFEVYNKPNATPEPTTMLLVGTGLALVKLRKKFGGT